MPVTTCENERSHSQMKVLKTSYRSTMSQDRLGSISLIKIHRSMAETLDIGVLVDKFEQRFPRRMLLKYMLCD